MAQVEKVAAKSHVGPWLAGLIAGDARFFFLGEAGASGDASYNYNDNSALDDSIAAGARGAYWDILRRLSTRWVVLLATTVLMTFGMTRCPGAGASVGLSLAGADHLRSPRLPHHPPDPTSVLEIGIGS